MVATLLSMSEEKKKPGRKKSGEEVDDRHAVAAIALRLPPLLASAIRESAKDNRRTLTAEIALAIEQYLERAKKWPADEAEEG